MREKWITASYESGTRTISRAAIEDARRPHFDIHGPSYKDEDARYRGDYETQEELCAFLNGSPPPRWLAGMRHGPGRSGESMTDDSGRKIHVTGPHVESEPGGGIGGSTPIPTSRPSGAR